MKTVFTDIFYFFFYSALGWFIESCYCSVKPRKWVNRGFLTGPLCPIYGTGALTFLVLVSPVKNIPMSAEIFGRNVNLTPVVVFFVSLVLADVVEFTVSVIMEKLFHARWWDYSDRFLNIQGRICLRHSVYWGTAGVLFLYFVHPFIDRYIGRIPMNIIYVLLAVIFVIFLIDVANAVKNAMDVRALMDKISAFRDIISGSFGNTVEEIISKSSNEIYEITEKLIERKAELDKQWTETKEKFEKLSGDIRSAGKEGKNRMLNEFPMMKNFAKEQLDSIEKKIEIIKNKYNKR